MPETLDTLFNFLHKVEDKELNRDWDEYERNSHWRDQRKQQENGGTAFSLEEFIKMIIKLLFISAWPSENPSGVPSKDSYFMLVSRTFNEHTLKSTFIMELITDLRLFSEGE